MRVLVTGAAGFIGTYLTDFLINERFEVYGTFFRKKAEKNLDGLRLMRCDVTKAKKVRSLITSIQPDRVYHLAAQSYPIFSWTRPRSTIVTNMIGTVNIFEAVKDLEIDTKILVACSSAEYGMVSKKEIPVREDHSLNPLHPYGVSKVGQDFLAYQYFKNFGIKTVRVRIFNTTGPGKLWDACSDFTSRIAKIEKGILKPPMKVGNLETKRDIMDVKDAVKALYLALERGVPGEVYNVCSSRTFKIEELLHIALDLAKIKIPYEVDPRFLRPSDEPIILGDNTKLKKRTGWMPTTPIQKTLADMLDYWRKVV